MLKGKAASPADDIAPPTQHFPNRSLARVSLLLGDAVLLGVAGYLLFAGHGLTARLVAIGCVLTGAWLGCLAVRL